MPDSSPKTALEQSLAKLDWAKHHIENLNAAMRRFHEANPVSTFTKTDLKTGDFTYYVREIPAIPTEIPLILGDALYSLRGALDYLARGLVPVFDHDTKFPIADSAKNYKSVLGRVVPRMGKDALEVLDSIHPYKGGNWLLWRLHKLNIIDKHRLLLTVCVVNPMRTLRPGEELSATSRLPERLLLEAREGRPNLIAENLFSPIPLKAGDKLLTVTAAESEQEIGFYFAVGIHEPEIAEGTPLVMLMDFLSRTVTDVIRKLTPFLLR
jgi:hypothetical protein